MSSYTIRSTPHPNSNAPTHGYTVSSAPNTPSRDALRVSAITSAAEILMSGCPLDLERMAVGRGTRTIYETVEIVVIKRGAARFHIEVWRSFAPWLRAALVAG